MRSVIVHKLNIKHQSAQPPAKAHQYFITYISHVKRSKVNHSPTQWKSLVFNTAVVVKGGSAHRLINRWCKRSETDMWPAVKPRQRWKCLARHRTNMNFKSLNCHLITTLIPPDVTSWNEDQIGHLTFTAAAGVLLTLVLSVYPV